VKAPNREVQIADTTPNHNLIDSFLFIHSFIHSFILIQAARPIDNRQSYDIKAHINIKNTEGQTKGKLYNKVNVRQRTERADANA